MDSCVLTSLVLSLVIMATSGQEEPLCAAACFPKFEYEFKVIQKLVELENKHKYLEDKINGQNEQIDRQREQLEKQNEVIDKQNKHFESKDLEIKGLTKALTGNQGLGTTYVRWGRKSCPGNGTERVYRGSMAGNHYNLDGGGANPLCMPEDPTWGEYVDGYNSGATLYGTELEIEHPVSEKMFRQGNNQDIPCAVCLSTRSLYILLPARTNCYSGWTKEYSGYLVASYPGHKGTSDYVCLDSELEFTGRGTINDNQHIVKPVEVRCGSLPCADEYIPILILPKEHEQ